MTVNDGQTLLLVSSWPEAFSLDFLSKEFKARWSREYRVIPLFVGHMVSQFEEESRMWVMANGLWTIARQVLAQEP